MAEPKIAACKPMCVDLEPDEHHWCACGHDHLDRFNTDDITTWK